jgi:hypothetical protein
MNKINKVELYHWDNLGKHSLTVESDDPILIDKLHALDCELVI